LFERRKDRGEQGLTLSLTTIFIQIKGTKGKGTEKTSSGWESFAMLISSVGEREKNTDTKKQL